VTGSGPATSIDAGSRTSGDTVAGTDRIDRSCRSPNMRLATDRIAPAAATQEQDG
jgi:hypothetical protein